MQRFSAFFFTEETILLFRPIRIRYSVNGAETGTDPAAEKEIPLCSASWRGWHNGMFA